MERYDLVVVGTGAGGGGAATRCAKAGWRVAIIDDEPYGGTCLLRGCDPKKVLVGVSELVDGYRRMSREGLTADNARLDWPALMRFKRTFTEPVPRQQETSYQKLGIATYHGGGRFTGPDRFLADGKELESKFFVVASGARPAPLGIPGEEHVKTSTDFLELDAIPRRIALIGAGYIAFEFAHIAARAGASVTMFGRGRPLKQFDADLVNRLVEHTRGLNIDVRLDAPVAAVERTGSEFHVKSGNATPPGADFEAADLVIHGAGRIPRTSELDLGRANVETDKRGAIEVNEWLQSVSNPKVYAAGDAVASPGALPLTPVGGHQSVIVASNLLHGNHRKPDYRGVSSVVFTTPPLAAVGLTEEAAKAQGLKVRVKSEDTRSWFSNRRVRETAAMYKTIVEEGTNRILGAHLLGPHADEVINLFAIAVRNNLTASDLAHMIYAYPTSGSDIAYMV
ncbi:MAG: NAD(P)/FAD-dependent oxidoreductase [Gemmatimonadetes bacterium]|nr:MAG: NAD(P)/FAD-dependent oxidoreductase [Gemmatimonadota bacterium]